MFVAMGSDWTTEIVNTTSAWCDSVYVVVYGTGPKARVASAHGSLEGLRTWLAQEVVNRRLPGKQPWVVMQLDAARLRTKTLCRGVGIRVISGVRGFPAGNLRHALFFEIDGAKYRG